jgi:hypothetical protein
MTHLFEIDRGPEPDSKACGYCPGFTLETTPPACHVFGVWLATKDREPMAPLRCKACLAAERAAGIEVDE